MTPEKFWDMAAPGFPKDEKRFEKINSIVIEKTNTYLKATDIVLDVGCGPGTKTIAFAGHVKHVLGIDISAKMIEMAEIKLADHNFSNIEFRHTTLFDETLQKESFDVIMIFAVLHALEDQQQVIQRITELLKPGGLFISSTPCLKEKMDGLNTIKFSLFLLLLKFGLFPNILTQFKFADLDRLLATEQLEIIETEALYDKISSYFVAAKKNK
ncbi:class I SAM-dependent methyltransferase [candidate division KSB1 bacterium]|nr:class I SAM-dependent methyltransferase [candidate division KSB1 bacterium]